MTHANEQPPSLARQAAQQAASRYAQNAARHVARKALLKVGAVIGTKGAAILVAVVLIIVLVLLLITILVSVISAGAQQTTAVWPVPVATTTAGTYQAGGWSISSRYGWRDSITGAGAEFHDGVDLVNPSNSCPFGYHCGVPSVFDGEVRYVGWDVPSSRDPSKEGGGITVRMQNGEEDHETVYAHLEPYRLYIQLQGRIDDLFDRSEYDDYRSYRPIGEGKLLPDATEASIEISCLGEMPNFVPTQRGSGTVIFLYDRPATCVTAVRWGERQDDWKGWIPDDVTAIVDGQARLPWTTVVDSGKRAKDVALTFKAHLVPPPPPPTETPTATITLTPPPTPVAGNALSVSQAPVRSWTGRVVQQQMPVSSTPVVSTLTRDGKPTKCASLEHGWVRCTWTIATIPTEQERFRQQPELWTSAMQSSVAKAAGHTEQRELSASVGATRSTIQAEAKPEELNDGLEQAELQPAIRTQTTAGQSSFGGVQAASVTQNPDCSSVPLVVLPNVRAPNAKLAQPAAESFAQVRADILARVGRDVLSVLSDVLRAPSFETPKPGVLRTSWHKAGRAVDLNTNGPFIRVPEGRMFRLFVDDVDITAIFEAHGWQRIPVQDDTLEWWHYEYHPDGISWTSTMLQIWEVKTLKTAFPEIAWDTIGCTGGSNGGTPSPESHAQNTEGMCVLGSPQFNGPVEFVDGCGPPVRAGDSVRMLDDTLGFVGLTGQTTGPHLHLGLRVKSYEGLWPQIDICTPDWLQGRVPDVNAYCFTDMADPLAFLPQAPPNVFVDGSQGIPNSKTQAGASTVGMLPEGAPYQLPPPDYPHSLVFAPTPNATPTGQYWSPFANGGQYGGGSVGEWFCANVWSGFPWCAM